MNDLSVYAKGVNQTKRVVNKRNNHASVGSR